ncbi:MAG: YARHG domain-containing protein [Lachnospiraceae bacterium]|nr:MAG: YARHG domain-containing protein [Lachnospiraceae bacterium]
MFCSKCGKQIRDGLKYCTNCGAPIEQCEDYKNSNTGNSDRILAGGKVNLKKDDSALSPVAVLQSGNSNDTDTDKNLPVKKPKKNKGFKIVIITILGIILAILLIFFALIQSGFISISIEDNEKQESILDKSDKPSKKEDDRKAKEKEHESESEERTMPTVSQTEPDTVPTVSQTETAPTTVALNNDFVLPDSSIRVLDKSELAGLSAEQCRIARNEIYAKHGRMFDDAGLQNYFNSCSWYHGTIPADRFSDTMLSDIEIKNRNLIVSYEKEKGYTK